ncbi:Osmotin, thaumatin-like protein [Meredithblackwellia eburnea MCA 4105]
MHTHSFVSSFGLLITLTTLATADRIFTFKNNCGYTVWPAITNYLEATYSGPRGWKAPPATSTTVSVPHQVNVRTWARRDCSFDGKGVGGCASGDAGGLLQPADGTTGSVNIGEINLNTDGKGIDWWDVSYVMGFNVPVKIAPDGCKAVNCPKDLNPSCPNDALKQKNASGHTVGCLQACFAGYNIGSGGKDNSNQCCSGSFFGGLAQCPVSGYDFYSFFKGGCEQAYAYPYDDVKGGTPVVYTCDATKNPGYTITFCPPAVLAEATTLAPGDLNLASPTAGASTSALDKIEGETMYVLVGAGLLIAVIIGGTVWYICYLNSRTKEATETSAAEAPMLSALGKTRATRRGTSLKGQGASGTLGNESDSSSDSSDNYGVFDEEKGSYNSSYNRRGKAI